MTEVQEHLRKLELPVPFYLLVKIHAQFHA